MYASQGFTGSQSWKRYAPSSCGGSKTYLRYDVPKGPIGYLWDSGLLLILYPYESFTLCTTFLLFFVYFSFSIQIISTNLESHSNVHSLLQSHLLSLHCHLRNTSLPTPFLTNFNANKRAQMPSFQIAFLEKKCSETTVSSGNERFFKKDKSSLRLSYLTFDTYFPNFRTSSTQTQISFKSVV